MVDLIGWPASACNTTGFIQGPGYAFRVEGCAGDCDSMWGSDLGTSWLIPDDASTTNQYLSIYLINDATLSIQELSLSRGRSLLAIADLQNTA